VKTRSGDTTDKRKEKAWRKWRMTRPERRMNGEVRMTKHTSNRRTTSSFGHSSLIRHSGFVILV